MTSAFSWKTFTLGKYRCGWNAGILCLDSCHVYQRNSERIVALRVDSDAPCLYVESILNTSLSGSAPLYRET